MRKLTLMVAIALLAFACTKEKKQIEPTKPIPGSSAYLDQSYTGLDMGYSEQEPCINGDANCLYYCCVTPLLVDDFIGAIDAGSAEVQDFLSAGTNLETLGQGVPYYENLLEDVRDGYKEVIYVQIGSSNLFGFLYGENVSTTNYEAAQILER